MIFQRPTWRAASFPPTAIEYNDNARAFRRFRRDCRYCPGGISRGKRAGTILPSPHTLEPLHFNRALRRAREICIREHSHRGLRGSRLV